MKVLTAEITVLEKHKWFQTGCRTFDLFEEKVLKIKDLYSIYIKKQ